MYYNMSSIHEILSASPFAELLIKSFDHFVGYDDGKKSKILPSTWEQKVKFLFNFLKFNRALPSAVSTFERRAIEFDASVEKAVVLQHHQDNFHAFIEIRMHSWYHASLADFFAMSFHGFLGKFAVQYYGEGGIGIQNQLIQAIPHLISSEPVIAMHSIIVKVRGDRALLEKLRGEEPMVFWNLIQKEKKWEEVFQMITQYLKNWGYRCSGELMLTHDNYIENPSALIALIKQMEGIADFDPAQKMKEKYAEAQSVKAAFRKKIMRQFWYRPDRIVVHLFLLHYLVKQSCNGISSRERVRLKQAQLYFGFKKTLHAIGENWVRQGFIDERDDILFFTYSEIAEHLESSSLLSQDIQGEIKNRKERWKEKSNESYPDDFYTYFGRYYQSHEVASKNHDKSAKGDLTGLCACGGRVEGTVRVLDSVLEADKLNPGDILVTRQTDPGWITVFPLISGLIVERGGMLSHGAIVSREFGIPAIVGVHEATRKLKDGDRITLNASQGIIALHDE
jgi:pyruvate,water dikinase